MAFREAVAPEPLDLLERPLGEGREVVEDYRILQLSLRAHPLSFLRPELDRVGIARCGDLSTMKDGSKVEIAGIVLIRQRPGKGNVMFVTLEDESGIANAIIWMRVFEANRRVLMSAPMIGIKGTVQREGQVIHVITERVEDHTSLLRSVGDTDFRHRTGPGDGAAHPGSPDSRERRAIRSLATASEEILRQKTRDFH